MIRASQPASTAAVSAMPRIRRVGVEQSGQWLAAAWADFRAAPGISLGLGGLFVGAAYLLAFGLAGLGLGSLILPVAAGLLLVAPLAAVGFYEVSRSRQRHQRPRFGAAVMAWRRNPQEIGLMGLVLMLIMLAWIEVALVVFALFFTGAPPSLEAFLVELSSSPAAVPFLLIGGACGAALAAAVFAIAAVSVPLLLDRPVTVMTAIRTSVAAVRLNWRVMIGWAALLVLLVAAGMAPFFLGLAVAMPLAGYASWHAYRALVP